MQLEVKAIRYEGILSVDDSQPTDPGSAHQ